MFDSINYIAMKTALDGLLMRQRVIADNIANIQTPGFLAGKVCFENELARAIRFGNPQSAHIATARPLEPAWIDGNNVNLDTEAISSVDTVLRFQLATQTMSAHYNGIRTAMRTTSWRPLELLESQVRA